MTDEQLKKANELFKKRDYYKDLAYRVGHAQSTKHFVDEKAKEDLEKFPDDSKSKWSLTKYFRIRFWNRPKLNKDGLPSRKTKPTIGVLPHWELAHEIEIDAEPELIDLIQKWLEDKAAKLDEEIAKL